MRFSGLSLLLLPLLALACQRQPAAPPQPAEAPLSRTLAANTSWLTASGEQLAAHYWPQAISIRPNGQTLEGPGAIAAYWEGVFGDSPRKNLQSLELVTAGGSEEYRYELASFETEDQRRFAQLVVWNLRDGSALRELEFTAEYANPSTDHSGVHTARQLWMQHCNDHRVERLINEVYTPNTLYYNHKPLLQGRAALIEAYDYMTNDGYHLTLTPIHTEMVRQDLALEIGQCSGSYGGRYVIVWQKQPDGRWMVLLDSNV